MKGRWRDAWRLAVGTLSALPVQPPRTVDAATARSAVLLAPLAVLPLGVLVAGLATAGSAVGLPPLATAALALGALAAGSRALHWDGLSDTVDGLTASYDARRSLQVMRSGSAGPAGVVAIVFVALLQVSGLAGLVGSVGGAVLAGVVVCLSRCAISLACLAGVPGARTDGLGAFFAGTVGRVSAVGLWAGAGLAASAAASMAGEEWWRGLLAVAVAALTVGAVVRRCVRRFGGVTGDVFGATVEVALAAMLLTLA